MSKKVVVLSYYDYRIVRKYPKWLFLFGDNDQKTGTGGQACIRHESNTAGIPTKKRPSNLKLSFYTDEEFKDNDDKIFNAIEHIKYIMVDYDAIVFPANGFGTGLADLPTKAPKTFQILKQHVKNLIVHYDSDAYLKINW